MAGQYFSDSASSASPTMLFTDRPRNQNGSCGEALPRNPDQIDQQRRNQRRGRDLHSRQQNAAGGMQQVASHLAGGHRGTGGKIGKTPGQRAHDPVVHPS